MNKYDLSPLKKKIAPRKNIAEQNEEDRFNQADDTLGFLTTESRVEHKSAATRVVRRTFSIPESELYLFDKIKDTALNRKIVLAESEVLRLGLLVASELTEDALAVAASRLEKMKLGRPSSKEQ